MRGMVSVAFILVSVATGLFGPALGAEEPSGCDKFKWNIEHERAALTAPDRARLTSGAEWAALPPAAMILMLRTPSEAGLPSAPERVPKEGTFAGFTSFKAAPKAGIYTISLSAGAWVTWSRTAMCSSPKASAAQPIARASARP